MRPAALVQLKVHAQVVIVGGDVVHSAPLGAYNKRRWTIRVRVLRIVLNKVHLKLRINLYLL